MAKTGPKSMSDEHKAALAAGRAQGRAVRDYLQALDHARPARGRKRSPESIQERLDKIDAEMPTASAVERLSLVQERRNLEAERASMDTALDISALEAAFVEFAKPYAERKGIEYASWREVGVPASVLRAAGITRTS